MRKQLALLLAAVACALALALLLRLGLADGAASIEPAADPIGAPARTSNEPRVTLLELERGSPADAAGRTAASQAATTGAALPYAAEVAPETVLLGRLVTEDGEPLEGVALRLGGWPGNEDRVRVHGQPARWEDATGTSAADGTYRLSFVAPRAFQFTLDAELPGRSEVNWRWGTLPQGETVDLGDTILWPSGTLLARVVDTDGAILTEGWRVLAEAELSVGEASPSGDGRNETRRSQRTPDAEGRFRIEGLPPGTIQLRAYSELANWVDGPSIELAAGGTVEADIVYGGPDSARRITAIVFPRNTSTFEIDDLELWLHGGSGGPYVAQRVENSSQSFAFDHLPSAVYRMDVDDPRFRPWSREGIEPGSSVDVHLVGSAGVLLEVVDAESGAAVERYGLRADRTDQDWMPSDFLLLQAGNTPPEGGAFDALVPGSYTLFVEANGYGAGRVEVEDLQPGEQRAVRVELRSPGAILGILTTHAGEPVAGRDVYLSPALQIPADADYGRIVQVVLDTPRRGPGHETATTDAQGGFRFEGLSAGSFDLRTSSEHVLRTRRGGLTLEAGERLEVELRLPQAGFASGRLLAPAGSPLDELSVRLDVDRARLSPLEQALRLFDQPAECVATPGADGSFRLGPFAPGPYVVALAYPDLDREGRNGPRQSFGLHHELDRLELPGGETTGLSYDLGPLVPGSLEVTLRTSGASGAAPPSPVRVEVHLRPSDPDRFTNATSVVEPDGVARIPWIRPGLYRLEFLGEDWCGAGPTVDVRPGVTTAADVSLEFTRRTLRVQDPKGAAGAGGLLRLRPVTGPDEAPSRVLAWRTLDANGQVEALLPDGAFSVSLRPAEGGRSGPEVRLDWPPAGSDPVQLTLEASN